MAPNKWSCERLKACLRKADEALSAREGGEAGSLVGGAQLLALRLHELEERYQHLQLVLKAIHRINQVILLEPDLDRVLAETCNILAEFKGVEGVWIGVADQPGEFIIKAYSSRAGESGAREVIGTRVDVHKNRCVRKALESDGVSCARVEHPDCRSCSLFGICGAHQVSICRLEYVGQLRGLLGAFISTAAGLGFDLYEILGQISQDVALALFRSDLEKALRESRKRYRHVMESSLDGFVIADMEGRFIEVNPAFLNLTGYSGEEIERLGWDDITAERWYRTDGEMMAYLFQEGHTPLCEQQLRRKDGSLVAVELRTYLKRSDEGIPSSTWSFVRDITARKAAEQERMNLEKQLQQAQKMEAIGTLAGGIAHDFNNILSAVIGYAELALDDIQPESRVHRNVREVLRAGIRARDLVKQILTFSRRNDEELCPLNPVPLVKEALKLLRSSLPSTIEIDSTIDQHTDNILGYSTQLYQVVMNLCTNAAQAMEPYDQGVLSVRLESMDVDDDFVRPYPNVSPGRFVRLTVADTGCGMVPEVVDRIFEPYFTTKPKGEGTGLGLAVVHGIVKNANGFIKVFSTPGKGSVFEVYFPAALKHTTAVEDEVAQVPGGRECILLVDDEPFLIDVLSQQLQRLGYHVVGRTSSIEALKLFENDIHRFDLVITDMTMPHLSGEQLVKEILALRPHMPIILCTGYSRRMTKEKADTLGIRSFLMKPIVFQELAAEIRKVLNTADEASAGGKEPGLQPLREEDRPDLRPFRSDHID